MLHKAYMNELRLWLKKWKGLIDKRNNMKTKIDKNILQKMRKRFYQDAFNKFKNNIKKNTQMAKNEDRTDDLIKRFQKREIKKIYCAWVAYKNQM